MRPFTTLLTILCLLILQAIPRAQRDSEFMKLFEQAREINDKGEMRRLVSKHYDSAITTSVEICQEIARRSNDTLEDQISALAAAWRKAHKSSFVDDMYSLYSLTLKGAYKKAHQDLLERWYPMQQTYANASSSKDDPKLTELGNEFLPMGDAFAELGDGFMAATCYRSGGYCFDETNRKEGADLKLACEAWGKFLDNWSGLQLKGDAFTQIKIRFEQLEFEGYGDPSKGPDARAKAKAAANPEYQPKPINASFELVDSIASVQRPIYSGDENYQLWPSIYLQKKGTSATFATLKDLSPKVLRTSYAKAYIDLNGDGEGDVEIPLGGKITPVRFKLGEGSEAREWAFLATVGLERDTYQGFDFNLGPTDDAMIIYFAGAGSIVGLIGETPIRVIDDNCDGRYGSKPMSWNYVGTAADSFQLDVDSLVVGESKIAVPWSELLKVDDRWYKLNSNEGGTDIVVARADVESASLKLSMKGPKADWVIVQGTGSLENCFYRVGKKGVEVPAGSYKLYCGQVSKGKRRSMMKALMLPSTSMRSWTVKPGQTTTLELGGPFGFDFTFKQDDETVSVIGDSIVVTGKNGETYQRLWGCVVQPEVFVRRQGAKKGKGAVKMKPVLSQQELEMHQNDRRWTWFPITKDFNKKKKGQDVELQLFQKKNRLFGKIQSDWKE